MYLRKHAFKINHKVAIFAVIHTFSTVSYGLAKITIILVVIAMTRKFNTLILERERM